MANITETQITSGEIGMLWMSYQFISMLEQVLGVFAKNNSDQKGKELLDFYVTENAKLLEQLKSIFENNNAILPMAFDSKDVEAGATRLFDDMFHIMFVRQMAKISLGLNSVQKTMSYNKEIRTFYTNAISMYSDVYDRSTEYLTEQGVLARPPYVTMPTQVDFIEDKKYLSGAMLIGEKRAINTLELSYIYSIVESNVFGLQLMAGFAQVSKYKDTKEYFVKGKELSKKIVSDLSEIFLDSDIQLPTTWAGKATESLMPPFSDKLMMYVCTIITGFAVGANGLGVAFNMRNDLRLKLAATTAESISFAIEGGKIMIAHNWLEKPPQMEDRKKLVKF